jgi:hypothetical protein
LAETGLYDIPVVYFFNYLWIDLALFECALESNDAEFGSGETFKGAVE